MRIARAVVWPDERVTIYLWPDPPAHFIDQGSAETWASGRGIRLAVEHAERNARRKKKKKKTSKKVAKKKKKKKKKKAKKKVTKKTAKKKTKKKRKPDREHWIFQGAGLWKKGPCRKSSAKNLEWASTIMRDSGMESRDGFPVLGPGTGYVPRVCGDARDVILQFLSEGSAHTLLEIKAGTGLGETTLFRELKHMAMDGGYPSIAIENQRKLVRTKAGVDRYQPARVYTITDTGRNQASWERQAASRMVLGDEGDVDAAAAQYTAEAFAANRKASVPNRVAEIDGMRSRYEWVVNKSGARSYSVEARFKEDPFEPEGEVVGRITVLKGSGDERTWGRHKTDFATVTELWIHPGHAVNRNVATVLFEHAAEVAESLGLHLASLPAIYLPQEQAEFWRHQEEMKRSQQHSYVSDTGFTARRHFLHRPPPDTLANPGPRSKVIASRTTDDQAVISAYVGRKKAGHIQLAKARPRDLTEQCQADLAQVQGGRPGITPYVVWKSHVYEPFRNQGIGNFLYEAALDYVRERHAPGAAAIVPMYCLSYGTSSVAARRVWESLARRRESATERAVLGNPRRSLEPTIGPMLRNPPGDRGVREIERRAASGDQEAMAELLKRKIRNSEVFAEQVALLALFGDPVAETVVQADVTIEGFFQRGHEILMAGPTFGVLTGIALVEAAWRIVYDTYGLDGAGMAYAKEVVNGARGWVANESRAKRFGGKPVRERMGAAFGDDWRDAARFIFDLDVVQLGQMRCDWRDVEITMGPASTRTETDQQNMALYLRCAAYRLAAVVGMAQVDPSGDGFADSKWPSALRSVYENTASIMDSAHGDRLGSPNNEHLPVSHKVLGAAVLEAITPWVMDRGPGIWPPAAPRRT